MGNISNYASSALVDHVFKSAYTPIETLYLALCTSAPAVDDTGSTIVETDYAGYGREAFLGASKFAAPSSRAIVQNNSIEMNQATGVSTDDITHFAILDAASGGNLLGFGAFNSAWNVVAGNTPVIASGQMVISAAAGSGAGFTNTAVHLMFNLMFRYQAWTSPNATIYAALASATIADAATSITELSGNGYARINVPAASMNAASEGDTTNNAIIAFPTATGAWTTFTSMALFDDSSAGNLLAYDNDNVTDQGASSGDVVRWSAGALTINLS